MEGVDAHAHVGHGDPTAFLLESAGVLGADLIVVGDRGLKGLRRMAGSVPNSLAHRATIDVLVRHAPLDRPAGNLPITYPYTAPVITL